MIQADLQICGIFAPLLCFEHMQLYFACILQNGANLYNETENKRRLQDVEIKTDTGLRSFREIT